MRCESCGKIAPTRRVTFQRNIGLVVMRLTRTISGQFCRECIDKHFWRFTALNSTLGWWGIISFAATLIFTVNNVRQYRDARSLESVGASSAPPPPASAPSQPPLPPDHAATIAARTLTMYLAQMTVRYQHLVFLSVAHGQEPDEALLRSAARYPVQVRAGARAAVEPGAVRDRETGESGLLIALGEAMATSPTSASIDAVITEGQAQITTIRHHFTWQGGAWQLATMEPVTTV